MRLFSRFNCRLCQKAVTLLKALAQSPAMGFYLSNSQITDETWQRLALPAVRQELGDYHPSSVTTQAYDDCDAKDHLTKILYTDFKTYLPGDILVKVDRMSMANSLEVRAPLLDYQLIEFAATLPPETKFRKGEKKIILKKAFLDDLPHEILERKKMGFSVPLAKWLQSELKDIAHSLIFEEKNTGLATYFRIHAIEELWQEHQAGTKDHSTVLWSLLMFQIWWKEYMTPDAEPAT
jgi:asparagine synthase (glutamine-hydrolysing)